VASHEYIEAATDAKSVGPEIRNADWGYYMEDPAWGILWGGQEVGDMCGSAGGATVGAYRVTRGWLRTSPACASPCGPAADDDLYFGAAPEKQIIELAIGESADVELTAFSQKEIADWRVSPVEPSQGAFGPGYGKHLEMSLEGGVSVDGGPSAIMANNGTKMKLHVKLVSAPPIDANYPSKTNERFRHAFAYVSSRLVVPGEDRPIVKAWPFTVRQKP
jgi:hypothetical protein